MNTSTARFAIKARVNGQDQYAQRIGKTQGKGVLIIWNVYSRKASLFTFEETEAIQARHKHRDISSVLVPIDNLQELPT